MCSKKVDEKGFVYLGKFVYNLTEFFYSSLFMGNFNFFNRNSSSLDI